MSFDICGAQLLEVRDVEAFQAYLGNQGEFVKSVSEQFASDAKAVAELGSAFGTEA